MICRTTGNDIYLLNVLHFFICQALKIDISVLQDRVDGIPDYFRLFMYLL